MERDQRQVETPHCAVCGRATPADQFGFVECACGWGGRGDPVESARGLSRRFTLLDRRLATRIAQRELARIARTKRAESASSLLYIALLSALSALIYLVIGGLLVGSIILLAQYVMQSAWLGVALFGLIVLYLLWTLFGLPSRIHGIVAPTSAYRQLVALLGPAHALGTRADFAGRRGGVASLAQMNDHELRAVPV